MKEVPAPIPDGQEYFQDDGTGNFSQATPVQGSTWGAIKARLK